MYEILSPLFLTALVWGMGIITGLGLGVALGTQRTEQRLREEW